MIKTNFCNFLLKLSLSVPKGLWHLCPRYGGVWTQKSHKNAKFSNSSLKCNFMHSTLKTYFLCRICRLLCFILSMQICLLTLILNVHKINQIQKRKSQFPNEIASCTPYLSLASASIHFHGFNHLQTHPKCMQLMQQVILLSPCSPSSTHYSND